ALLDFADDVDFTKRYGRSLENLEYLLRHEAPREASAKTRSRLVQSLATIRAALQSGEVLRNTGSDNLVRQLEPSGVPPLLVEGLRSDNSLKLVLQAEIVVSPITAPRPVIPENLRGRFYFIVETDRQSARFGCRGAVSDTDFDDLTKVGTGEVAVPIGQRNALKSRYALIRDVLLSQLQYHPVPVLKSDATAAPSPAIPDHFAGFLSYSLSDNRIQLAGLITSDQRDSLKAALPQLSAQLDILFTRSEEFRQQN